MNEVLRTAAGLGVAPAAACISPAAYWMPRWLRPESAWMQHGPFGFWLIDALRPKTMVELGTYSGYSFAVFCQAVQALGVDCACYGVDHWKGDEHGGFYSDDVFQAIKDHVDTHYVSFAQLIRSDFNTALEYFEEKSIDLLHIDGCHSYEAVRGDFLAWRSRLSGSGVVVLHDTNVHERGFGVAQLFRELAQEHKHFEFLHGYGLGIIGVGEAFPERIEALFRCSGDAEATAELRLYYSRLGLALSDRVERQTSSDQARLAKLENDVISRARKQAYLTGVVEQREATIAQLTTERRSLSAEHEQRGTLLAELQASLAQSQAGFGQCQEALARIEASNAALATELERCRAALARIDRYVGPIRRSFLWPLTSPLRSAVRRVLARGK